MFWAESGPAARVRARSGASLRIERTGDVGPPEGDQGSGNIAREVGPYKASPTAGDRRNDEPRNLWSARRPSLTLGGLVGDAVRGGGHVPELSVADREVQLS
jgi:hypothetical protein